MKTSLRILATALLALLNACGGGGGSDTPESSAPAVAVQPPVAAQPAAEPEPPAGSLAEKFAGTWLSCSFSANAWIRQTVTYVKTSEAALNFTAKSELFLGTNCTGTLHGTTTASGTVTFLGKTKTIGSETVEKIDMVTNGSPFKQVTVIKRDGHMHLGLLTGPLDAEGFPDTLSPVARTRQ